ncbi:MAG: hypothetical protein H7Y32_08610 [Chloroflexales bacterium]|nr:hypothetical protein [Chloroflexales bacterium]
MLGMLKARFYRDSALHTIVRAYKAQQQVRRWHAQGRPAKMPHLLKEYVVQAYGRRYGLHTLVETGTFRGDMIVACGRTFGQIYSIELDPQLHSAARVRFRGYSTVALLQGDSADVLPGVLAQLAAPALFWLDAHYSGGVTARSASDTSIVRELDLILAQRAHAHVVLIDDAHEFVGANDYPRLDDLRAHLRSARPDLMLDVRHNIIRIVPAP